MGFCRNASALLQNEVTATLELSTLVSLVSSNELDVDEVLIFHAVIR